MADCEFLTLCPFFNDKMEKLYCKWNYRQCGRDMVAIVLGKDKIPLDLFPRDTHRAKIILTQYNHP